MRDMVLILNWDDASSRAIARTLRAEHIYCRIVSPTTTREEIAAAAPLGIILSGGVNGTVPTGMDEGLLSGDYPILALGDTAAMFCLAKGGDVEETLFGSRIGTVTFTKCGLTEGLDDCERMLHNVRRLRLPEMLKPLAFCKQETVGFMHRTASLYGVQFTLEQNDTDGMQLLTNFALNVCGCTRWWDYEAFVERTVEEIGAAVGTGRAVCSMTGGLDSGVTAMLAHKALGDRLQCIFIDTGLMRENEAKRFLTFYRDQMGLNITHVQAQEAFVDALKGVRDPAEKRRIVGTLLQQTLDETLKTLGDFNTVMRATTCNDVLNGIDFSSRPGIHAELPQMEPLKDLFRDEIRRVGEYLGMPNEIISRQTFPGSGLALRILGEATPAHLQTLRAADQIFTDEIISAGQSKRLWQFFALLSSMTEDNARSVVILRAVNATSSAQQAYPARVPYDLLERVTDRILRERPEVVRVVYDLSPSSRYAGVEWQ